MATKLQGTAGGMRIHGEGKRRREGSLIHVLDVATICVAKVSNGGDNEALLSFGCPSVPST